MKKIILADFNFHDPWMNLAYETCLLNYVEKSSFINDEIFIFALWQNRNTIVVGRNQNITAECNLSAVKEDKVYIARRITGGGAVFHDEGNLNFSFIFPKKYYDMKLTTSIIVDAMKELGIDVSVSGRNDMFVSKRKFSGNAYYSNNYVGLHHGTILISSDLSKMSKYLTPDKNVYKSGAVASIKSRVINLSEISKVLSIKSVKDRLICTFNSKIRDVLGVPIEYADIGSFEISKLTEVYKKYSSYDWIFGETRGKLICKDYFPWGNVEFYFYLHDDKIKNCEILTDSIYLDIWEIIERDLIGADYNKIGILDRLIQIESTITDRDYLSILGDVKTMFGRVSLL